MRSSYFAASFLFAIAAAAAVATAQQPLQPPPVPPQNAVTPAKAVLGKMLFYEEQLSSNNLVACGTCHRPEHGGGDPRRAPHPGADGLIGTPDDTFGSPGVIRSDAANDYLPSALFGLRPQVTGRNSPSNLTAAWSPLLFWDGRAGGAFTDPAGSQVLIPAGGALESQAAAPILEPSEMAHDLRQWGDVTGKLQNVVPMALASNLTPDITAALAIDSTYPALFARAFGDPSISAARVAMALATYQRTLVADQTPWDQFQRNVPNALTMAQVMGMNLFNGPARCNLCHTPGLFTDHQFRNLGLRPIAQDRGRQAVTNNFADRGRFKVPSLRNVGLRPGFMHTGQFTTLDQVVGFYAAGGGPNLDNKDPLLVPLNLPPMARQQLIDFVANALTDPRVRNRQAPFDRPTLRSEMQPPGGFLYGNASNGTGGIAPVMLAAVPANLGNVDFKLGIDRARGGAQAVLGFSFHAASPGSTVIGLPLHIDLAAQPTLLVVPLHGAIGAAGAGYGSLCTTAPNAPSLRGTTLFAQWLVWDAGVASGAAVTQGAQVPLF